jgi:2-keto-3-deoxy-L-arabinonate dehydratase
MLCYGKRLFARQIGVAEVFDRAPALAPTDFGLAETERFAAEIGAAVRA